MGSGRGPERNKHISVDGRRTFQVSQDCRRAELTAQSTVETAADGVWSLRPPSSRVGEQSPSSSAGSQSRVEALRVFADLKFAAMFQLENGYRNKPVRNIF